MDQAHWSFGFRAQAMTAKPSPIALIYLGRALRGFADGYAIILLPVYLTALGYSPAQVGLAATAALCGTALLTLGVGLIARSHQLRTLLIVGALVMTATGAGLPSFEQFGIILLVAFVGTINPSGGDIGLLVPLEHAAIAKGVTARRRTHAFARYSLVGALSAAAGSLAAVTPEWISAAGVSQLAALKLMFYLYGAFGVVAALLYSRLPRLPQTDAPAAPPAPPLGASRGIVIRLAALFSLDSFAGGFAVQSLIALWLFEQFELSLAAASTFFFVASVLSAFSYPVAAWLGHRYGLVNTMVFTHIPSSLCLIAAAFAPNALVALVLLSVRAALSQMDVPTRTSYVMAVVTPEEQPAAASFTAVPRSLASSLSPALAGVLLGSAFPALPFVICGVLKIVYDVALLQSFRHIKPPEESEMPPMAE
jgi:MFS family permease